MGKRKKRRRVHRVKRKNQQGSLFDELNAMYKGTGVKVKQVEKGSAPPNKTKSEEEDESENNGGWFKTAKGLWQKVTGTRTEYRTSAPSKRSTSKRLPSSRPTDAGNYSGNRVGFKRGSTYVYGNQASGNYGYGNYGESYGSGSSYGTYSYGSSYTSTAWKPKAANLESLKSGEALCSVYFKELPEDATAGIKAAFKVLSTISKAMLIDVSVSLDLKTRNEQELNAAVKKMDYSMAVSQEVFKTETDLGKAIDCFLGQGIHEFANIAYRDYEFEKGPILEAAQVDNPVTMFFYEAFEYSRVDSLVKQDFNGFYNFLRKYQEYAKGRLDEALRDGKRSMDNEEKEKAEILQTMVKHIQLNIQISDEIIEKAKEEAQPIYKEVNKLIGDAPMQAEDSLQRATIISKACGDMFQNIADYVSFLDKMKEMFKKVINSSVQKVGHDGRKKDSLSRSEIRGVDSELDENSEVRRSIEVDHAGLFEYSLGGVRDVFDNKVYEERESYEKNYDEISSYISTLKRQIKVKMANREDLDKGRRSGRLDTSKLVEAIQGVNSVYQRKYKTVNNKVRITLLIDESGSMGGHKISVAKKIAILFSEATAGMKNVDLSIYGHSADIIYNSIGDRETAYGKCVILPYKESGSGKKFSKFVLGGIRARGNNRDGEAIAEVCDRMLKRGGPGIVIVLSDGAPASRGYDGMNHTRKVVKDYGKAGFNIMQVAIDNACDPSELFENYFEFTDLQKVPGDMGKLLNRLMKDHLIKSTVEI